MRLLPYGRDAVLAEVDGDGVPALAAAAAAIPGVEQVVPGAGTVLVQTRPGMLPRIRSVLNSLAVAPAEDAARADPVVLDVVYDGQDLDGSAALAGMSVAELIDLHTDAEYVVAFCGFAPGFGYLRGSDARLHLPRLDAPRTRVPAGAVGIAGEFTGAYPRASPGGWRLLGRTTAVLWDERRDPPALLTPGTPVRFRQVS